MTSQQLYDECAKKVKSYPKGMQRSPDGFPIAGRGFFPVTSGSLHDGSIDIEIGKRKILLVGQDWGCQAALGPLSSDHNYDVKTATGKTLTDLLDEAEISLEDCFFTNALFGVRAGDIDVGRSPGWKSETFVDRCVEAMEVQIAALTPKVVVCLGRDAPDLLVNIFEQCGNWRKTFKLIDKEGDAVFRNSDGMIGAILLHPSYRRANAWRRSFKGDKGHAAEVAILRSVWDQAKLSAK